MPVLLFFAIDSGCAVNKGYPSDLRSAAEMAWRMSSIGVSPTQSSISRSPPFLVSLLRTLQAMFVSMS